MRELATGDLEEFRRAGHALVDAVADHLAALPGRPVWQPVPDDLRAELLSLPLPDEPTALGPLGGAMARDVLPYAMGNGHPAFFGWVNPPPSLAGVLASLTAAAMNPTYTWSARRCAGWRSWSATRMRRARAC
jgi:aromatic-L-amino-acid decarboxylase